MNGRIFGRSFAVVGTSLALSLVIMMPVFAEEIYLSSKGPSATVTQLTGQGTANANLQAKVARIGAEEYCKRDPGGVTREYGGDLTQEQCVEQLLLDDGTVTHMAAANCERGLLRDTSSRTLTHAGPAEYGGIRWVDSKTGDEIGNCGACNDTASTSQFELMCPFYSR